MRALRPEGEIGVVWTTPRARVYRAIDLLAERGLIAEEGTESSAVGPVRTLLAATPAGWRALARWLAAPVRHLRDARSELLLKLLLHDRLGRDPSRLLATQRRAFAELAGSLERRSGSAEGFDRVLLLWRQTSVQATLDFLERAGRLYDGSA